MTTSEAPKEPSKTTDPDDPKKTKGKAKKAETVQQQLPAVQNGVRDEESQLRTADQIWDQMQTAADLNELNKLKALIYGGTGSSKTHMTALFGDVLIGVTEKQAITEIRKANPKARIFLVDNSTRLNEFRRIIHDPNLGNRGITALGVDSFTDIQRVIKDAYHHAQKKAQKEGSRKGESPDSIHQDTWGQIIDRTSKIARELRDIPLHSIVICLDQEFQVDGIGTTHRPALQGKSLPNQIGQYFNVVGYAYKTMRANGMRWEVMFQASEAYATKSMWGLDAIEPPEPLWWCHKVFGDPLPADVAQRVEAWKALDKQQDSVADGPEKEDNSSTGEHDPFAQQDS